MRPFDPRLLRIAPQARAGVIGLFLLGAVQGLAAIASAFAIAALVVAIAQAQPWQPAALATLVAFAVRGLAAGAAERWAAHTGALVSTTIRHRILAAALTHDAAESRSGSPGSAAGAGEAAGDASGDASGSGSHGPPPSDRSGRLVTLAGQGATSIEPYVARYLPTLATAAILPPAAILAMLILDWRTGLIPVLTVPLLPVFAALIGSATARATDRRWRTLAALSGHFLDVMRGLPTLVSYGRAERQVAVIREVSHEHRLASIATLKLAFLSSAALELLATISVAIVAVWVGIQLAQGDMALSLAMPLILLAPEAYWPIRRVGAEFHNAADGAAALADVAAALDVPSTAAAAAPASPAHAAPLSVSAPAAGPDPEGAGEPVRIENLSYTYDGASAPTLAGLSTDLPHPGLTVVTGPSGVGKTTLLEIVAGLRRPRSGVVRGPRGYLVTQRPFLAAGTLRDNLLLGVPDRDVGPPTDGHLNKALADVGLAEFSRSLPNGLNTPIGDDGFGLSAGQRARVALARALLADPALLLLDEPTAHLDGESEQIVHEVLTELARTRTVVAVTHRAGLVSRAAYRLELAAVS
ncbi:MAG: thiol reductant ABC exporter subunit CydD [Austwickia sp.]|nr:thiol reductant ABC exporter subunit CydD [Austwickia sp.]